MYNRSHGKSHVKNLTPGAKVHIKRAFSKVRRQQEKAEEAKEEWERCPHCWDECCGGWCA